MSRSGYSDDCENVALWRAAVDSAILGRRGQVFMRRLRDALDAMPSKRLITGEIATDDGVCALGSVDPMCRIDPYDREAIGQHFGIAPAMAAEIAYINDEDGRAEWETPEERWTRMRAWVDKQIAADDEADPRPGA